MFQYNFALIKIDLFKLVKKIKTKLTATLDEKGQT